MQPREPEDAGSLYADIPDDAVVPAPPPADHSRGAGNTESAKAFDRVAPFLSIGHMKVLRWMADHPAGSTLTDLESIPMKRTTASGRRSELAFDALVYAEGVRPNPTGGSEGVYFITDRGRRNLADLEAEHAAADDGAS